MNESGGAQNQTPHHPGASALAPGAYVVIAGFGLSGRAVAEQLEERDISYCVIETNVSTVNRCLRTGMRIIDGSVLDEATLRQANIERATLVALTIPDDKTILAATELVRRLNPGARIIARCAFTSTGLQANQLGADEVIVVEQVIAGKFASSILECSVK